MFADFDPLDLKPGQMVSDWRIVRRIGSGGYAVVYEVERDGERFALKVACQTERSIDPRQTDARARREVACLQQLNHRHFTPLAPAVQATPHLLLAPALPSAAETFSWIFYTYSSPPSLLDEISWIYVT